MKFNYKAGISIYNSTIAQPAKLSASRYEPDPCSLAEVRRHSIPNVAFIHINQVHGRVLGVCVGIVMQEAKLK